MKRLVPFSTLLLLFLFSSSSLLAQLSDLHYLPPLKQRDLGFDAQVINLTTPETTPFTVYVYRGTSTSPVATLSVSQSTVATYNPGNGNNNITLLTDDNTGKVMSTAGLRFESTGGHKFYVNWRGHSASQGSSLTTKGRNALGTAFKWVGAPNKGAYYNALSSSLGIMATEDNTTVNIFGYNPACTFRLGTNEAGITADAITVTLNKGQTYVLEAPYTGSTSANGDGWLGASITSNNPIAVNFGEMHYEPKAGSTARDVGIDQIIPENALGKDYIFVRGNGVDVTEFPIIIATQNDTKIYVNGATSPVATINNGDYYLIPSTYYSQSSTSSSKPGANMYVHTSKEVYAVQSLAGSTSEATVDLNFIAPVNCLLANKVDNIPDVSSVAGQSITGGITIIASSAISTSNITVKYGSNTVSTSTLNAAKKTVAGNSDWNTYFLSGLSGNVSVSATGPIAVGFFGVNNVIGASGYFSGFETIPTIEVQRVGDGCLPGTILTATPGFTAYTWYRDGAVVPGVSSNSYTPSVAGKYTVTVTNGTCSYSSANQSVFDCHPEIVINTTADKNGIMSGETVTFRISVNVLSDLDVNDLVLTNLVPSNVTVLSDSATYGTVSHSGSTYTWNIGTMRNGEEHILYITARGKTVSTATPGTLTVSKTQTITGTESNKIPDDTTETVTVYSALANEPTSPVTGLYFTNTGSAKPFNNVLHFTPSPDAEGYLIVRHVGTAPTFVPVDGHSYTTGLQGGDEIIYVGGDSVATDYSAQSSADYHYAIYAYNGGGEATNYLTSQPVLAVINNPTAASLGMGNSSKSTSAGLADEGVNVTFETGLGGSGTTISGACYRDSTPQNYSQGLPAGVYGVHNLFYHVGSSVASPGYYTIVLDYSGLDLTDIQWATARVLKRSSSTSNWVEITDKVVDRKADGLTGKLVIKGLNSFSDFAIAAETLLPVNWVNVAAAAKGQSVLVSWSTATEQNSKLFVVERSSDGQNWSAIGQQEAAGNSLVLRNYQYLDKAPAGGINYYRIREEDVDGKSSLSRQVSVTMEKTPDPLVFYTNPVLNGLLKIELSSPARIQLYDTNGHIFYQHDAGKGKLTINVSEYSKGIYILKIAEHTYKVMVQ